MPHNRGISLTEVLVVVVIISATLALVMPGINFDRSTTRPALIEYLRQQRSEALEKGRTNIIRYQENTLVASLSGTTLKLEDSQSLVIQYPEPSAYLPYQEIALFYPDGTSIVSEFSLKSKEVERAEQILYNIQINPFDGEISYSQP